MQSYPDFTESKQMNERNDVSVTADSRSIARTLLDQTDLAVGEASSVMGAMLSEVMRRGLNQGVLRLGEELQTFAKERVEESLNERTPQIEARAGEVARSAAQETAEEVVKVEVERVEEVVKIGDESTRAELKTRLQSLTERSVKCTHQLKDRISKLEELAHNQARQLRDERERFEELQDRLADLEKPRGLRKLFGWLAFWRKKK